MISGKGSCSGDNGGSLLSFNGENGSKYLRGISSFGPKKCGNVSTSTTT